MIVHSKLPTFFNCLLVIRKSTTADMCMVHMDKTHPLIVQWILYKHRNFGQQIRLKDLETSSVNVVHPLKLTGNMQML